MKYYPLILCIMIISYGCSMTKPPTMKPNSDNNSYSQSNSQIYKINMGDTVAIRLNSNPSTGFSWNWQNEKEAAAVVLEGKEYITDEVIITGSPVLEIWKFKGVSAGTDTIKLAYFQSFNPETIDQSQVVVIQVNETKSLDRLVVSFKSKGAGIDREAYTNYKSLLAKEFPTIPITEAPWGREGEIDICVDFKDMPQSKREDFLQRSKEILKDRYAEIRINEACRK